MITDTAHLSGKSAWVKSAQKFLYISFSARIFTERVDADQQTHGPR
jgi:hypothetical protein